MVELGDVEMVELGDVEMVELGDVESVSHECVRQALKETRASPG
jgi:hypothetical protein